MPVPTGSVSMQHALGTPCADSYSTCALCNTMLMMNHASRGHHLCARRPGRYSSCRCENTSTPRIHALYSRTASGQLMVSRCRTTVSRVVGSQYVLSSNTGRLSRHHTAVSEPARRHRHSPRLSSSMAATSKREIFLVTVNFTDLSIP